MNTNLDVLSVMREYAQDTGSFRVTKQGATNLAAACAAVAELIEAASEFDGYIASENGDKSIIDQDAMRDRLGAALRRVRGES